MAIELEERRQHIQLRNRSLDYSKKTLVMGILNATPDSFSDGGRHLTIEAAVQQAQKMIKEGADLIDIGGESTRPGFEPVPLEVELERVIPVIEAIRAFSDIPISIDTYKAETARQAIKAGADIINDIWGAKADPEMAYVAKETKAPIILMHNRKNKDYRDLIEDMKADLLESVEIVKQAGVTDQQIILDPGIGFAKTYADNLNAMNHLEAFHDLGFPLLLGTSRKRFIGLTLNAEVHERLEGTGATVCLGISKGVQIVRVHDVGPISKMVKMMDAMVKR
ncbi:dihydropteroate synthase [Pullulanibacillus sp. KACC 23026]|uniref:dihydropteroate synthase n=1 Tax=Pullulanibacillus sp. KACC 23026 TaxID=3028315 RepID=UPI0023B0B71C|nr:dihydropteroate synthase [Pullulanibacillus sp. KACC 23026]WEG12708.1 dihydropteroate synthase [Pullulanibacillus sp. KACC 23026]